MLSIRVGTDRDLVTTEAPAAQAAPDEAVVAVAASSVNRGELALIDARGEGWSPGQDVAGVVVEAAADGSGPAVGDRVAGLAEQGAWSEQVVVRANRLAVVPEPVGLRTAASLPMAGLTALRTVRMLGSVLGRRILITGASGGVGRLQTQLARLAGAEVVAVARSGPVPGATTTVTDVRDIAAVDGALESIGGHALTEALSRLRPGAPLVWFGSTSGDSAPLSIHDFIGHERVTIHTYFSYAADSGEDADDLDVLLRLVEAGHLAPHVSAHWPLEQAAKGVRRLRDGGVGGKIILVNDSLPSQVGDRLGLA